MTVASFALAIVFVVVSASLALLPTGGRAAGAEFAIVREGKPACAIVVAQDAPEPVAFAAAELQKYVAAISGAELPILAERPAGQPAIIVGDAPEALRALIPPRYEDDDRFLMAVDGDALYLCGADARGTLYSVYALLERFGCRWISPWEEVVPTSPTLAVPGDLRVVESADTRVRGFYLEDREGVEPYLGWLAKVRINTVGQGTQKNKAIVTDLTRKLGLRNRYGVHTYSVFMPPEKYGEAHPEWFPLIDGERRATGGGRRLQLCLSNAEMTRTFAENVIAFLRDNPSFSSVAISPNDSPGGWCECDACRAMDDPAHPGDMARRASIFANRVAEQVLRELPDARFHMLCAYHVERRPPEDVTINPRISALAAPRNKGCYRHAFDDPKCPSNQPVFADLKAWQGKVDEIVLHEYYYKHYIMSRIWPLGRDIQRQLKALKSVSEGGVITQSKHAAFWAMAPNYYLFAKAAWDIDADVDAILADYCRAFYGKAGDPILRYYTLWLDAMDGPGPCQTREQFDYVTQERLDEADGILTEAAALADDETIRRRIGELQKHVQYNRHLKAILAAKDTPAEGPARVAALAFLKTVSPEEQLLDLEEAYLSIGQNQGFSMLASKWRPEAEAPGE